MGSRFSRASRHGRGALRSVRIDGGWRRRRAAVLRLEDALARALDARPELVAADAERRALEAAERQAALLPNPDLVLEVEDVAGTGDFGGASEAQTTLRVFQPIELGGDRRARRAVAAAHSALASFDRRGAASRRARRDRGGLRGAC